MALPIRLNGSALGQWQAAPFKRFSVWSTATAENVYSMEDPERRYPWEDDTF